tara:strand:- start:2762 stop:3172 length:411 start_codon:yes stop_codon:yes gene_type:complete
MKTKNNMVIGLVIGCILTYFLIEIRNRCFIKNNATKMLHDKINILLRQTARWATAAKQDENPLIAVLHANYGAGYLWALKDIATGNQINSASGIDIVKFEKEIIKTQDEATTNLAKVCPNYAPKKSYLSRIAKEGN